MLRCKGLVAVRFGDYGALGIAGLFVDFVVVVWIDDVCDFADFVLQVGGFGFDIVGFCVLNFSRRSGKGCSILSLRSRWRLESLVPAADVDIIAENVKGNSS